MNLFEFYNEKILDPHEYVYIFCMCLWTQDESDDESTRPLAESLLTAIADLLFCPDFTVESNHRTSAVTFSSSLFLSHTHCVLQWDKTKSLPSLFLTLRVKLHLSIWLLHWLGYKEDLICVSWFRTPLLIFSP